MLTKWSGHDNMIVSKVIVELRFMKRVPKHVLESAVEKFADQKQKLVAPYKKYDKTAHMRVWYEDFAKANVKVTEMLPNNPFKRIFKKIPSRKRGGQERRKI